MGFLSRASAPHRRASWRRTIAAIGLVASALAPPAPAGLAAAAALVLVAPVAHAAPYPARTGWVTDEAGALRPEGKAAVERELAEIERRTSAEVAAVVVKSLGSKTIEDYSYELARGWKLGKAGKDNGVLLLVALDERKARIETGKGVGEQLPDLVCNDILREQVTPKLKQNDLAGGLLAGAHAIGQRLDGKGPAAASGGGLSTRARVLIGVAVGGLLLGWLMLLRQVARQREELAPGSRRRRQIEALEPLARALELLQGEDGRPIGWLGASSQERADKIRREQRCVADAIEHLSSWDWTAYLNPIGTGNRLDELRISSYSDGLGRPLLEVMESLDKEVIRRTSYVDKSLLSDGTQARAELKRRIALVTPLIEAAAPAWEEMRGDPDLTRIMPPRRLVAVLERANAALQGSSLRAGFEACADAAWLVAVVSCWQHNPAWRYHERNRACEENARAASRCRQGDECMEILSWWAAYHFYCEARVSREQSTARPSAGSGSSVHSPEGGSSGYGGSSSYDGGGSSSYDSGSSSGYDGGSSGGSDSSGGGGDFGGGGSSSDW